MPELGRGAEWPKALYRDGGPDLIWGLPVQTIAVQSAEDEMEALAQGWRLHPVARDPLDHDGNGHRGGSVDGLDQMTTDDLRQLAAPLKLHHKTGRDKLLSALRENTDEHQV